MKKLIRFYKRRKNFYQALKKANEIGSYKLVIGASQKFDNGWIPSEKWFLDVTNKHDWSKHFKKNSISNILAEHVWEHLPLEDSLKALKNCIQYLKPNGIIRIAVPDGYHKDESYINSVKPGGTGAGAHDHKILYNYESLSESLTEIGFEIRLVEYFDKNRQFQKSNWLISDGKINRSFEFDRRNFDGHPNYTSLIIDGIKK